MYHDSDNVVPCGTEPGQDIEPVRDGQQSPLLTSPSPSGDRVPDPVCWFTTQICQAIFLSEYNSPTHRLSKSGSA